MNPLRNVNKLEISTVFRKEKSVNGISMDILKSGMQKYVRRGNFKKAVWCAIEMDLFAYMTMPGERGFSDDEKKRAEAIRTNMINRLRVIFLEDVGISGAHMIGCLDTRFDKLFEWQSRRKTALDLKTFNQIREKEMKTLVEIISLLCEAKKNRILSHYRAVYMNPIEEHQVRIMEQNPELFEGIDDPPKGSPLKYPLEGSEETPESRNMIDHFVSALLLKEDIVFYWLKQILDGFTPTKKRFKSLKPELFVFDILLWFCRKSTIDLKSIKSDIEIMLKWFKDKRLTFKEINFTLFYSVMMILKRDVILDRSNLKCLIAPIERDALYSMYTINLNNDVPKFDDYVIDIHTFAGRAENKNKLAFALVGAHVENEDLLVVNDLYKTIYNDTKSWEVGSLKKKKRKAAAVVVPKPVVPKKQVKMTLGAAQTEPEGLIRVQRDDIEVDPNTKSESERFQFLLRVQLITSNSKTCTYFAIDRVTGKRVVVKGPFADDEKVKGYFVLNNIKKKYFSGVLPIDMYKLYLIPDQFETLPPLGDRKKIVPNKLYPFFISEDLCSVDNIPFKTKESKVWPKTKVFDGDAAKKMGCYFGEPLVLKNDHRAMIQFLLASAFRYVVKIPDPAKRNFLYINKSGRGGNVYSIDEDSYGSRDTENFWYTMKREEIETVFNFASSHYDEVAGYFETWLQKIDPSKNKGTVMRIKKLQDKQHFLALIRNSIKVKVVKK
jgi:hypothetical protein